jgi:hypothetical protein
MFKCNFVNLPSYWFSILGRLLKEYERLGAGRINKIWEEYET